MTNAEEDVRSAARLAKLLTKGESSHSKLHFNDSTIQVMDEFWASNRRLRPSSYWKKSLRLIAWRTKSPAPLIWGFWQRNQSWIRPAVFVGAVLVAMLVVLQIKFPRFFNKYIKRETPRVQQLSPEIPKQEPTKQPNP
jgi:hypothetical protein